MSPAGNTVIVNRDRLLPTKTVNTLSFGSIGDCRTEDGYTGTLRNPFGSDGEQDTGCGFASGDRDWYTVRYHQTGALATLSHPVGSDVEVFSEARLIPEFDWFYRLAPSSGLFEFTPSRPEDYGGSGGDLFRAAHTFVAHGDREARIDGREYRVSSGVRGRTAAGLGYGAHVTAYRYERDRGGGPYVSRSAIQAALAGGAYDLENPLSTPEAVIRSTSLRLDEEYRADYKELRVALNGALDAPGSGTAEWMAGAELAWEARRRRVDFRDHAGRTHPNPSRDVVGLSRLGSWTHDGERRRASAFAELSFALHDDWEVALTGRGDDYDDVGGAPSYRAATRYRLNDRVTLRGSLGRGARPPGLAALSRAAFQSTAWACDSTRHGDSEEPCALRKVTHEVVANPGLEPERSQSASAGVALSLGRVSLGADWFRLELSRTPLAFAGSARTILALEAAGALPVGVTVIRDREGNLIGVRSSWGNTGKEAISGFDVAVEGAWPTGWADVGLELHWLHRTDYKAWDGGARLPGHLARNSVHGMSGPVGTRSPRAGASTPGPATRTRGEPGASGPGSATISV